MFFILQRYKLFFLICSATNNRCCIVLLLCGPYAFFLIQPHSKIAIYFPRTGPLPTTVVLWLEAITFKTYCRAVAVISMSHCPIFILITLKHPRLIFLLSIRERQRAAAFSVKMYPGVPWCVWREEGSGELDPPSSKIML